MAGNLTGVRVGGVLAAVAAAVVVAAVAGAAGTDSCTTSTTQDHRWCGDGGAATKARLNFPQGVAYTSDGRLLIADTSNSVVRMVDPGGVITTIAGTGELGEDGDGGPATAARLRFPRCVLEQSDGSLLIQDLSAIRLIKDGVISTVTGPDPCRQARLPNGDYLTPYMNVVLRTTPDGVTSVAAGNGMCGGSESGGSAKKAELAKPLGVAATPDGGFVIADTSNDAIRRVSPSGEMTTVAGQVVSHCAAPKPGNTNQLVVQSAFVNLPGSLHAKAGKAIAVKYSSTFNGVAYFTLTHSGKVKFRGQAKVSSGTNHYKLPAIKKKGKYKGKYKLTLKVLGTISTGTSNKPFSKTDYVAFTIK